MSEIFGLPPPALACELLMHVISNVDMMASETCSKDFLIRGPSQACSPLIGQLLASVLGPHLKKSVLVLN
jgi:hypothetical protein